MNNEIIIRTENIVKEFPSGSGVLTVLKGISLEIKRGEIFSIVGPSGAGKSTLLHILGLLDRPTSGSVYFHERFLAHLKPAEESHLRNTTFGFVFQFYHLIPELTVWENVLLPFMIRHSLVKWWALKRELVPRAQKLLNRLGLSERLKHRVNQLSGGERQRLAIARAFITDPEVIFCDEPTGNLDQATSQEIQNLIWELNRNFGKTFIIVTHEESIAKKAHRMIHLIDGRVVMPAETHN